VSHQNQDAKPTLKTKCLILLTADYLLMPWC